MTFVWVCYAQVLHMKLQNRSLKAAILLNLIQEDTVQLFWLTDLPILPVYS